MHGKFNCITVKYNGIQHDIYLARICVTSNYPLNIIHSFNLVKTFYDLFHHICMSPDSPDSHMKKFGSRWVPINGWEKDFDGVPAGRMSMLTVR